MGTGTLELSRTPTLTTHSGPSVAASTEVDSVAQRVPTCGPGPSVVDSAPSQRTGVSASIAGENQPLNSIDICAWNINGGLSDKLGMDDIQEFLNEFDIILLSESWLYPWEDISISQSYETINIARSKIHPHARRNSGGLVVAVKNTISKFVSIVARTCDHIVVVKIKNTSDIFIIFVYLPPEGTTFLCDCGSDYISSLNETIAKFVNMGQVYVCGDFNARTGNMGGCDPSKCIVDSQDTDLLYVNTHSSPVRMPNQISRPSQDTVINNRGKALVDLCDAANFIILNGQMGSDEGTGAFTCCRSTGKSVVDYLLSQPMNINNIQSFSFRNTHLTDSDHVALSFSLNLNSTIGKSINTSNQNTFTLSTIKWDPSMVTSYLDHLQTDPDCLSEYSNFLNHCIANAPSNIVAISLLQYIENAASKVFKIKSSKKNKTCRPENVWYDNDCKKLKVAIKQNPQQSHAFLYKEYKRVTQKKKRQYQIKTLNDIQDCKDSAKMWNLLKGINPQKKHCNKEIPVPSNVMYSALSTPPNYDEMCDPTSKTIVPKITTKTENLIHPSLQTSITDLLNNLFTEEEIKNGLSKLKPKKASGVDGLPAETLKSATEILSYPLTLLFNYILVKQEYPIDWAIGLLSPLHKKGDKTNPDNYRPITVRPAFSKLYEILIHNRLEFIADILQDQDKYNGGFKKGSQTTDNMFILTSCIQKQQVMKRPLYIAFIDFRKAFDLVDRTLLFEKLNKNGKGGKLLKVIQDMYSKTRSHIKLNGVITDAFEESIGVAQGGVLSPYFFVQFLSDLHDYLDKSSGIRLGDDEILMHLLWADDLILLSTSSSDLQNQLDNLAHYSSLWRLIVNIIKTKILVYGDKDPPIFHLGNNVIDTTTQYQYVGCIFSDQQGFQANIEHIKKQASKAIHSVYGNCKPLGQIPPILACSLFDSLVSPILEYGSPVWYNKDNAKELEVVHLQFLKNVLRIKNQTATPAVLGELGRIPLTAKLQTRLLTYWARIVLLPDSHLLKISYNMLHELHMLGSKTWCREIIDTLQLYNLQHLWDNNHLINKVNIKKHILNFHHNSTIRDIHDTNKFPKLRTYKLLKEDMTPEIYLKITIPKYRISLTQFRTSSHTLEIERGRYHKPIIPSEKRICNYCNLQEIDDEHHFLLKCPFNHSLRQELLNYVQNHISNILELPTSERFISLLTADNLSVLTATGKFISNSFKKRNTVLCQRAKI
jgi:hypothetical protein